MSVVHEVPVQPSWLPIQTSVLLSTAASFGTTPLGSGYRPPAGAVIAEYNSGAAAAALYRLFPVLALFRYMRCHPLALAA